MASIIRMPQVVEMTGVSRAHVYALIARDEFPRPVRIGKRAVGWIVEDIEAWISARPSAGRWNKAAKLSQNRRESLDGGQP